MLALVRVGEHPVTTAARRRLARRGVCDRRRDGGTLRRPHLSNAIDDLYVEIARIHGVEGARLAAESHTAAVDRIEALAAAESIACDFERLDGYLFTPPAQDSAVLDEELRASHEAGLTDVALVPRAPLDGFDTGPALRFPRQAQFHVLKYLSGLVSAIERRGGRIHCGTRAEAVTGGRTARVRTRAGVVMCDAVVVATNTPFVSRVLVHARQHAYVTYAIGAMLPRGTTRALYWDTADPYHYVRVHTLPEGEVLMVGGEDHKVGQADDGDRRWAALESWARERFAAMGAVTNRWSGEVLEPVDRVGLIGPNPNDHENVFIVTGDTGMGMTHATIAGMLLTDLIHRRDNRWARLYDPARVRLRAARPFVAEAANMAAQYGRWLRGGDVDSVDAVAPGDGAVVRRGVAKVAVYRDEAGVAHERSAMCPHLGCAVAWNDAERTWDCPCHGALRSVRPSPQRPRRRRPGAGRAPGTPAPRLLSDPAPSRRPPDWPVRDPANWHLTRQFARRKWPGKEAACRSPSIATSRCRWRGRSRRTSSA